MSIVSVQFVKKKTKKYLLILGSRMSFVLLSTSLSEYQGAFEKLKLNSSQDQSGEFQIHLSFLPKIIVGIGFALYLIPRHLSDEKINGCAREEANVKEG